MAVSRRRRRRGWDIFYHEVIDYLLFMIFRFVFGYVGVNGC